MPQKRAFLLALGVAVAALVVWRLATWQRVVERGSTDTLDVVVVTRDSSFFYWGDYYSDAVTTRANALGDTTLGIEHADGEVELRASNFSCDRDLVTVTDSTLVPVAVGAVTCGVSKGAFSDTLSLVVQDEGGRLVVVEVGV